MRLALIALVALATWGGGARAETIMGTGSAFAAPVYVKWAEAAKAGAGIEFNYQASGSGVGQAQVVKGLVDVGASDVPMAAETLKEANILQFPTVVGGVAVFVNLPDIHADELRLTGPILADIYMGDIKQWNDPRIATLNPGLSLPAIAITPLHHATASGTTFAVSSYFSKVSDAWKKRMGVGMVLEWPGGAGVKGSFGAASTVPTFPGSIGYAESSYASTNHLTTVRLENRAGKYVASSAASFAAAADSADWAASPNFAVDLTNMPGDGSWPIITATFVLVPRSSEKASSSATALKFFDWAFDHGDDIARELQYVPLPGKVKDAIRTTWKN